MKLARSSYEPLFCITFFNAARTFLIVSLLKTVGFSNSNEAYKYVKIFQLKLMKKECVKANFMKQFRKNWRLTD
jgi:hypothetical protein